MPRTRRHNPSHAGPLLSLPYSAVAGVVLSLLLLWPGRNRQPLARPPPSLATCGLGHCPLANAAHSRQLPASVAPEPDRPLRLWSMKMEGQNANRIFLVGPIVNPITRVNSA